MTEFSLVAELNEYPGGAMDCNVKLLKKLDDTTVLIDGVKYQKVVEKEPKPQTLYDALNLSLYIPLNAHIYVNHKKICDTVREYLNFHTIIETEDAEKVTFTILKEQLQTPK